MNSVGRRLVPSTGGTVLEALVERPSTTHDLGLSILICHPHPEQGGTMRAPIIGAIAKEATNAGFTAVRFNFRGVGESTGTHDRGIGEVSDVAVMAGFIEDEMPDLAGIAGWSFGAAVSLQWHTRAHSPIPYVGIAPPVDSPLTPALPQNHALHTAPRLFIVGERDQFVDVPALNLYATSSDAMIEIYPGSDHFFVFKHERLARDVVDFVSSAEASR